MEPRRPRRTPAGVRWRRILVAVALTTVALILAGVVDLVSGSTDSRRLSFTGTSGPGSPSPTPVRPSPTHPTGTPATQPVSQVTDPALSVPPGPRPSVPRTTVAEPPVRTAEQRTVTRACHYIPFGTSARPVGPPSRRPVHATRLVLRVRLGASAVVRTIVIALTPRNAPCAVNSVYHLARAGFYKQTPCPRLTTRYLFVLQCGDPSGTGAGGPGYRFHAEVSGRDRYPAGTVAMATSTPNTTGSQFFIVYRTTRLEPKFPVIGHVVRGLAVVSAIATHGATARYRLGDGFPRLPVHIVSAAAGCAPAHATPGSALSVQRCPVRTLPQ